MHWIKLTLPFLCVYVQERYHGSKDIPRYLPFAVSYVRQAIKSAQHSFTHCDLAQNFGIS
jgi:hypothetical protein